MTIHKTPPVMIFHLKRFSFGSMFGKVKKHIEFTPFIDVPCDLSSGPSHNPSSEQPAKSKQSVVKYELTGIIVHHGSSANSGHYVAYVKVRSHQRYLAEYIATTKLIVQNMYNV